LTNIKLNHYIHTTGINITNTITISITSFSHNIDVAVEWSNKWKMPFNKSN